MASSHDLHPHFIVTSLHAHDQRKTGPGSHPVPASPPLPPFLPRSLRRGGEGGCSLRADSTEQRSAVLTEEVKRRVQDECVPKQRKSEPKNKCKVENTANTAALTAVSALIKMTEYPTILSELSS